MREIASGSKSPAAAMKGTRGVYLSEAGSFIDCPIYDRYALLQGNVVSGPAVIEEVDSTTLVYPDYVADVDQRGALILTKAH